MIALHRRTSVAKHGLQAAEAMQGLYAVFGITPERIADVVAYALDLPEDTTVSDFTIGPARQLW